MSANVEGFGANGFDTFSDDATRTLLARTVTPNSVGFSITRVEARRVSDGAGKVFFLEFGFKRNTGDAEVFGVVLLGEKGNAADLSALAAVSATLDALGSDVRVRITGLAGTEIDWACTESGEAVVHV